jgi:hypothetical protein
MHPHLIYKPRDGHMTDSPRGVLHAYFAWYLHAHIRYARDDDPSHCGARNLTMTSPHEGKRAQLQAAQCSYIIRQETETRCYCK